MPLQPGSTLLNGQYRIVGQLGRGGYGFVYCAQDCLLAEQVAIKELIPALVGDEATLKRFLAEAKATMRLTHHRIVRTHNVFSETGNYYIVMEYMPGGSLEARLRERAKLPVDEAVRVTNQICEGLGHAHALGVVHCDLKPANILFAADGSAKVADFGIAHVSEQMLTRTWLTPAGFVAGTLPYLSPEQTDGVRDDPRVDVYAVGAVLYRMLTGKTYLDFDQRDTPRASADNVYRIQTEQPVAPSADNPRVPRWLDEIVLKALAKQPPDRFASAEEIRSALKTRQAAVAALPTAMAATVEVSAKRGPVPAAVPSGEVSAKRGPVSAAVPPKAKRLPSWFWAAVAGAATLVLVLVVLGIALGTGGGKATTTPAPTAFVAVQPTPTESEAIPSATTTPLPTDTRLPPSPTAPPTVTALQAPTYTSSPEPTPTPTLAPSATLAPSPAATATAKPKPVVPTPTQITYPVPVLSEPAEGASLSAPTWFRWGWAGTLKADEYFDVRVWQSGMPHYGVAWTKEREYRYDPSTRGPGTFYWSVAVIRGQNGTWLANLSPEAPPRQFVSVSGRPYGYGGVLILPSALAGQRPAVVGELHTKIGVLSLVLAGALVLTLLILVIRPIIRQSNSRLFSAGARWLLAFGVPRIVWIAIEQLRMLWEQSRGS
jgi:serine/threonine protein kinase